MLHIFATLAIQQLLHLLIFRAYVIDAAVAKFGAQAGASGWLDDHNVLRCVHGAKPLSWDSDLESKAQSWAATLDAANRMYHSDCYGVWPPSGENLAYGMGRCSYSGQDIATGVTVPEADYDQHCAVAAWYNEYNDYWRGSGSWRDASGIGHFTAMVWKGIDLIGCASSGMYFVCEYGSTQCKSKEARGGPDCWSPVPSHLPNFNMAQCAGKDSDCVAPAGNCDSLPSASSGLGALSSSGGGTLLFSLACILGLFLLIGFGAKHFCNHDEDGEDIDEEGEGEYDCGDDVGTAREFYLSEN